MKSVALELVIRCHQVFMIDSHHRGMSDQTRLNAEAEGLQVIAEERVASTVANISPVVERVVAWLRMDPRAQTVASTG
jgi:hypothetical protein